MPKIVEVPGYGNVEFPDTMSDQEISFQVRKSMAAQPAQAPAQEQPGMMAGIGAAVGQGAADVLGGIGSGVFKTARGLGQLAGVSSPYLDKLATPPDSAAGRAGQMIEQGAEFLLPGGLIRRGAGMLAAAPAAARIAGTAGLEGLAAAGVAGVQSGGDAETMRNAALAGGALSGLGSTAGALVPRLRESAVTQYGRVLNPTKEKTKAIAQRIVPELVRRREWTAGLPRMLERSQDRIRYFGQQIDDVWSAMENAGVQADIHPVLQRLDDVAREHYYTTNAAGQLVPLRGPAERGLRELQGIGETLVDASVADPATGARVIPTNTLRQLRQYWDEVADKGGAFTKRPQDIQSWTQAMAHRYAGDAVRAELGRALPELANINREFAFWRNVADVTEQTLTRRTGQQKPLTRRIAQLAGAEAGGGGLMSVLGAAAMDQMQGLLSSAAWGTISAVTKDRLANALAAGNRNQAVFYLNQALRSAGMGAVTTRAEPVSR